MGSDDRSGDDELAAARARIRMLESLLIRSPDFLVQVRLDGTVVYINRTLGMDPADVLHKRTIYDFIEPAYHDLTRSTIAKVLETGTVHGYETMVQGSSGHRAPYYTRVAPLVDADGKVDTLVLVATDVSQIKQVEAQYAEAQAMLRHVLATTEMGMWWWDVETNEGGYDAQTATIFGFEPGQGTSLEPVMSRIHPDDAAHVQAALAAAVATETGVYGPLEHRVARPDGSVRWVRANGRWMGGATRRMAGGTVDITERKLLEEQLAQAQKLESIGRLAGGIAHDFNNLLTAIVSYNEFAMMELPEGSPVERDLQQVRAAADRSIALTSQLLAFARQQIIEPKVTLVDPIVLGVDQLIRRVLGETIEVVTVLDARRPVRVDVNQFEQVLLNLSTNARDAMPGGGRLTLRSSDVDLDATAAAAHGLPPGAWVQLEVTDTGEGIPAALVPRVFEPFFTTKDLGKGTGLGLATCHGIVAQNHGQITVTSAVGKGTTFTILLPAAGAMGASTNPSAPVVMDEASTRARGVETVLVVEDAPSVRAVTVKALEQAGYRVLVAGDGVEALTVVRDHPGAIDLLLTDVVMPQLGGVQLAELLARSRPEIAVLYMSGYTDSASIHEGVLAGTVDLLHKPFAPSALVQRVRQAIDRRPRHAAPAATPGAGGGVPSAR